MLKKILFSFIITSFLFVQQINGQGIEGKISDSKGNPVGYASIFIKELSRGTTSNSLGIFSLPLPSGEYHIFFRSLGYTEVFKTITLSEKMEQIEIILPPQTYMIPEVRVSASGEDPAYRVMRKAIGLSNYHLNQVSSYNAEIYIKGTAYFHKLPKAIAKRIEVGNVKVEEGTAYMLESINDVTYGAPDKYEYKVIASQNTIPGYLESVNPLDYINASLYQPQIEGFVSPLARNAFFYYKFNFEGSFLQGSHMIDKIKVIPKRKSQQLCSGYLYIVEDLWCIHSSDLAVATIAGTLILQQQYANVIMDSWLPVSHKLEMDVEIAGVVANVTYVSSLEYKKTNLNPNLPKSYFEPINQAIAKPNGKEATKEQVQINEILDKDEINDRDMAKLTRLMEKETEKADTSKNKLEVNKTQFSVEKGALTNDSLFWKDRRPVPLTLEEHTTLSERDAKMGLGGRDTIRTTTSIRPPKKQTVKFKDVLQGKMLLSANRKTKFTYAGLIDPSMLTFNSVDGFSYGQHLNIDHRPIGNAIYRADLKASYDFARETPNLIWTSSILYAPEVRGKIALRMNYHSEDFNHTSPIPVLSNEIYSLFLKENYTKRYERISASLEHRMDLATGFVFYATLNVENRRELLNNTTFSFFKRDSSYTPNHPNEYNVDNKVFNDSKLLTGQITLEYTHDYYYKLKNQRKQYFKSDYPTIYFSYRRTIPVANTDWAEYSFISGGLRHEKEVGLLSELKYKLEAGYFPNKQQMHFSDFSHFKAAPLAIGLSDFTEAFTLLDYYSASTNEYYFKGHMSLESPYLLLKMLPWVSERLWTETLSVSYLKTPDINHHMQLGYSLNDIGFLMDVGVFVAFEDWSYYGTGVRLNLKF